MGNGLETLEAMRAAYEALAPLDPDGRQRAVAWLAGELGVSISPVPRSTGGESGRAAIDHATAAGGAGVAGMDPKTFLRSKNPRSDVERVTVLGYFLAHGRETPHFKSRDITELNVEAAGPRFSNTAQAVKDAAKRDFLASVGEGKKQVTALGEAVVEALPERDAVKAVLEELGRRRRRKPSSRKATSGTS